MYRYLEDFEKFYEIYIKLHNYTTGVTYSRKSGSSATSNAEVIKDVHRRTSGTFIKIIEYYETGGGIDYVSLMSEDKFLFDEMFKSIEQHFISGAKLEYLVSGSNLVFACFCHMTISSDLNSDEKITMLENLRKISDAYSVVVVSAWFNLEAKEAQLIDERERFKNYLDSRASLIIFVDNIGNILRLNSAAKSYFAINTEGKTYNVMDVLDYHFLSFDLFIEQYSQNELKPTRLMNGEKFDAGIHPLMYKNDKVIEYVVTFKKALKMRKNINDNEQGLTSTEANVCTMIEKGMSSKEIAEGLNISIDTVKTHRRNIRKKLNLRKTGTNMYVYLKKKN